jgi:hypothetical protein
LEKRNEILDHEIEQLKQKTSELPKTMKGYKDAIS